VNLSSLSGMQLAAQMLDVVGHNVANLSTPDALQAQVNPQTSASGGVTSTISVTQNSSSPTPDLVEQVAQMIQAQVLYAANAQLFRTADDTYGALFDIRA
jgi:flagellar basal-body rod protein FlgC